MQTSGIQLSPTSSDWECLPRFCKKRLSRAVEKCGSADWGSFMDHACWWSAHFLLAVREFLNGLFLKHTIARSGPTERPAISPDLNP